MRHLLTTGVDRVMKIWDVLEPGTAAPVQQRQVNNWPGESTWVGNYPVIQTAEQTMGINPSGSYVFVVGGNQEVQQRMAASSSTGAWSVTASSWLHATVTQVVPDTVLSFGRPTFSK
jgi:hypothetical protein